MKFLNILFAFYILMLPCFSCTDSVSCTDDSKKEMAVATADHKEHQEEKDACNPLCICACCGQIFYTSVFQEKLIRIKPAENLKLQLFYRNITLPNNCYGNIWQPPKLS